VTSRKGRQRDETVRDVIDPRVVLTRSICRPCERTVVHLSVFLFIVILDLVVIKLSRDFKLL
jgi:hypothetical protein